MSLGRRLYKLSFVSGLMFVAPLIIGTLWYAWSAFANLDRSRRALDPKRSLDLELFHVALHDELTRDLRWLGMPERPTHDTLPTFAISIPRAGIDALSLQLQGRAPRAYVPVLIEKDGKVRKGSLRYRGEQPWNVLGVQKSMKIELEKGELVDGVRTFNLINDPTPFGVEDQLILELAREEGLLAPEYRPVRVRLNNADLGVFRFESQPDETLLRQLRRMPGDMFAGESEGPSSVFTSSSAWRRIARRGSEHADDDGPLHRLLAAVEGASYLGFAEYAEAELDLDRYARFGALDVVFGGNEHDYLSNHRFYVDPYRGRLEPVAWSFRGFQHEESFDAIDHPLLVRLEQVSGWLARRDREVYALLTGKASVPAVRARAERIMGTKIEELAADPFWDAYKVLPHASRFHRFFTRPMTLERWGLAAQHELVGFEARSRWLLDQLDAPGLEVLSGAPIDGRVFPVAITVSGHAAYAIGELRAGCAAELRADADRDGRLDPTKDPVARPGLELSSRPRLVARADPSPKRGPVRVELEPTRYDFFVVAECSPALVLESLVTGASTRVELSPGAATLSAARDELAVDRVPRLAPGELAPHRWAYPWRVAPAPLELGPGRVELTSARRFEGEVRIAAGTTLALGPEVSLVFLDKLSAIGAPGRPIRVVRLDPTRPYGGIALQGPRTRGSRLVELELEGGGRARSDRVDYTGLINVHDSSDVALEAVRIRGAEGSDDVVHVTSVQGIALHELSVSGAPVDAVDVELSSGELRGLRLSGAGDDCLDLMSSTLRLQDSALTDCKSNAISAGEQTDLTVVGAAIARAKTGVLSKNASEVRLIRVLIDGTERALKARRQEVRYGGPSRIGTSEVYVTGSEVVHDADKGSTIELDDVSTDAPPRGPLTALLGAAP